ENRFPKQSMLTDTWTGTLSEATVFFFSHVQSLQSSHFSQHLHALAAARQELSQASAGRPTAGLAHEEQAPPALAQHGASPGQACVWNARAPITTVPPSGT